VAHCPLSNAYFSSTEIFRLREALDRGVKVGLGSDIAGGYELGIQGVMRMSVAVSRLREGLLKRESQTPGEPAVNNPRIGWKESLYLATKGGAEAMGLSQGCFNVGAPFDAQQSTSISITIRRSFWSDVSLTCLAFIPVVRVYDPTTGEGVGSLDFLDHDEKSPLLQFKLTEDVVEKWWSLGDTRNRVAVWVQGNSLL
jgi:guanine deaminase